MRDYSFENPAHVPAGRAVIRVHNRGRVPHELILAPLPSDYPAVQVQLHSNRRRPLPAVLVMPPRPPGGDGVIAVDLVPGRYGIFSFVRDAEGTPDALRGMGSEFQVS